MKRFLAATDGSRDGEHAVAMACTLAQRAGGEFARLEVDSVAPSWEPELEWWNAAQKGTATRLRGLPGIEIVRHAESWGADLVVLGRHDRTAEGPFTLGETADTVIRRHSGLSLFAPPETGSFERALVAVDGSLRGLGVLAPAKALLNLTKAQVGAICILPGTLVEGLDTSAKWDPRSTRITSLLDRLTLDNGPCELEVRWGNPVPEILRTIRETSTDLLILGVRRGGQAGDLGSGYVGRELLKAAPCAVLTVPI